MAIRITNHTRTVWHFPFFERKGAVTSEIGRAVLGDSADLNVDGARHEILQPSPVLVLSDDDFERLGSQNHRLLDGLAAAGDVTVEQGVDERPTTVLAAAEPERGGNRSGGSVLA